MNHGMARSDKRKEREAHRGQTFDSFLAEEVAAGAFSATELDEAFDEMRQDVARSDKRKERDAVGVYLTVGTGRNRENIRGPFKVLCSNCGAVDRGVPHTCPGRWTGSKT